MTFDTVFKPDLDPKVKGPFEFRAPVEIGEDLVEAVVEVGGMVIAYWAQAMVEADDGIAIAWYEEEGNPDTLTRKNATWQALARGLAEIAFGKGARRDLVEHARRAIFEKDAGEIDGEIADVAIQYALFDEIVYG